MVDVNRQLSAVDRKVSTRVVDGTPARVQTLAQSYNSSIAVVWDAATTADRIRRWFLPVNGDLRLGGRYQIEGNAGGVVLECAPPGAGTTAHYKVTWEFGGGITWVTVRLTAVDGGSTRLELEHVANVADVPEGMWEQFGPSATGIGWDSMLLGLGLFVAGAQDGVSPDEAAAWLATDEGKNFLRRSADHWGAAHQRDGADSVVASAAADRAYAAYAGEAPDPMAQD